MIYIMSYKYNKVAEFQSFKVKLHPLKKLCNSETLPLCDFVPLKLCIFETLQLQKNELPGTYLSFG